VERYEINRLRQKTILGGKRGVLGCDYNGSPPVVGQKISNLGKVRYIKEWEGKEWVTCGGELRAQGSQAGKNPFWDLYGGLSIREEK